MPNYTLDWTDAGSNGTYATTTGGDAVGLSVTTSTSTAGQTAAVSSIGTPAQEALWVSGLTEPVTTTISFDDPIRDLNFEIFDLDSSIDGWDDKITIIALDADGNEVPITFSDLDGLHSVENGNELNADGNLSGGVETSGADDSVTVAIAGPIVSLTFIFDNGESIENSGTFGVSDISFTSGPDFTVSGTAGDDLIDLGYLGDADGDRVDNLDAADGSNDDVIEAGAGNDTAYGGLGNDTIHGGDGDDSLFGDEGDDVIYGGAGIDTVEAGYGNDTFFGGAGNDRVNGDHGDDVLHGGTGDDFLRGSFGNDTLYTGNNEGDDYLWGGYGDDTFVVSNNFGNDTIDAENEDEVNGDTLDLSAVTDDLTVDLSSPNQGSGSFTDGVSTATFIDIENIVLSAGTDTLVLSDESGADVVQSFEGPTDNGDGTFTGHDQLDVSTLTRDTGTTPVNTNDVVVSDDGNGNAVLTFPGGESLTLIGVTPAELSTPASLEAIGIPGTSDGIVSGTAGNDFIFSGYAGDTDGDFIDNNDAHLAGEVGNDDIVQAGDGNDEIYSGDGNDEVYGGAGDDTVFAGVGNDSVFGGEDSDTLFGEDGDDALLGEDGDDKLSGGTGDDTLTGGSGADRLFGNDDADMFLGGNAGDMVDGGEGGTDNDTLDLTGSGPLRVVYDAANSENGNVNFLDGAGNVTGTMTFENIETVIPCFTPGTLIRTPQGNRPVESLRQGDPVLTRDNGVQKIRWVGSKTIDYRNLLADPKLRPVFIPKGALGDDLPERDMMLSPNHRVLISNYKTSLYLGEDEAFVTAKHLINDTGIQQVDAAGINYIHFMFDQHQVVLSDGSWTESFQPGDQSLRGIDDDQRAEIFDLFPELERQHGLEAYLSSRKTLKHFEARLVAG